MAELTMLSYKLQDLQFFNKLDAPGQIQLENNFSFSVNYNRDNTRCMAKLYQCVKDKTDPTTVFSCRWSWRAFLR